MKKPGFRAGVDKLCRQCIYGSHPGNGTWRAQVEACTSYSCAVYHLRPVTQGGSRDNLKIIDSILAIAAK